MKTPEELYDRFKNLQEIKKIEQVDIIRAGFDEHDLESLLYRGLVYRKGKFVYLDPEKRYDE